MVLVRILVVMGIGGSESLVKVIDEQIQLQNHQSLTCIKSIRQFLKNPNSKIQQHDLSNSCHVYECDFQFIVEDITRFRA